MNETRANKSKRWRIFKGTLTRLIFILHGVVSFYLLYNKNDLQLIHLLLIIPFGSSLIEGVVTLCLREGKEAKYFWPCGFFYITTIVPIIWILELDLLEQRQNKLKSFNSTASVSNNDITSNLLTYMNKMTDQVDGRKFAEIGVIIGVILGRWLSPRTAMSRNQLSNLLLGYVANAADIMELFESLESPGVIYATDVTIGVLSVYTWSLLQFTLITTATTDNKKAIKDKENRENIDVRNKVLPTQPRQHMEPHIDQTDRSPAYTNIDAQRSQQTGCCQCCRCHPEFFQIFVTLFMQDGPFLILRICLMVIYDVMTELHIFFMCKNGIVIILLIYRLIILGSREEGDLDDEYIAADALDEIEIPDTKDIGINNPVLDEEDENRNKESCNVIGTSEENNDDIDVEEVSEINEAEDLDSPETIVFVEEHGEGAKGSNVDINKRPDSPEMREFGLFD